MRKDVKIFLDSGAPSLYNTLMRTDKEATHMGSYLGDRKHDDFSYIETPEYKEYMEKYIAFIQEHEENLEVYANFDVINNPEETWNNQQIMEKAGLQPMPVYHLGSDLKWLKMYLEKGYEYIAMGGMVPNPPNILIPALDSIWDELLTDKKGMPKIKIHGFAVTSVQLVNRYPWYSVDSTSWVKFGRYGVVCIPRIVNGKYDYISNAWNVAISVRSPANRKQGKHYDTYSPAEKKLIGEYIESKGLKIGKSEIFTATKDYTPKENEQKFSSDLGGDDLTYERVLEPGVSNSYKLRDELNIMYYLDLEASIPEWPWAYKHKKKIRKFQIKK